MNKPIHLYFCRICLLVWATACFLPAARAGDVEAFFKAAEMDNPEDIRAFLQQGMDPNVREKYRGDTALIVALREGSMGVFEVLVNTPGIDLEARANNGDNALMMAAFRGNQAAVDVLLKKGAAVNRSDWTALHYAAVGGKNKIAQILLDKGAEINARSPNQSTPLMVAAYEGNFSTVKLLLDQGADVRLKNEQGMNAIDFSKRFDRPDITDLLKDHMKKTEQHAMQQAAWDALY